QALRDVAGGLERRLGGRVVPFLRDGGAALVAHAPVVRRERRRRDEGNRNRLREKAALRDHRGGLLRALPLERERGGRRGLLLQFLRIVDAGDPLRELEPDRVEPAAEQEERGAVL